MKTTPNRKGKPGFVSYVVVISTGIVLMVLMVSSYRRAMAAHQVQATVQLRTDYSEKEDAILRSLVAITPNRAIRAMQHNSNSSSTLRDPLRWQGIFTEALDIANARTSVSAAMLTSMGKDTAKGGNLGDSGLTDPRRIFRAVEGESGYVSRGLNRSLGTGYPVPLTSASSTTTSYDRLYPIISRDKFYGTDAQSGVGLPVEDYPEFNLLTYPQINFGYARPGDPFVAKRNWWAFSLSVADHDDNVTFVSSPARDFVLSIYEIPSQLAISASSFMSLGEYASGEAWSNVSIAGGIYAGRARVEGETALNALASRRGMTLSDDSSIGGTSFGSNPFTPGLREAYQLTQGEFFPVSLASESGRVAFVPINRGEDYFDRFAHEDESSTVSTTTWNDYSIGALQCAMRLDICEVESSTNMMPTELRFSYMQGGIRRERDIQLKDDASTGLPPGYLYACVENDSYDFGDTVVDVAYGLNGDYAYQTGVTGVVEFNNARFGDPLVGFRKNGYFRPSYPWEVKMLADGKICLAVYPERFEEFLRAIDADEADVNHSLAVNVDYSTATGSINLERPSIPCTDLDYGVILLECGDLTSFTKGFSVVTNLRTYIGDDFNVVPTTPPTGYTPASGVFYPPCSLFAPEKRYGVEVDPFAVNLEGQVGSLASEDDVAPVRPLDSKTLSGNTLSADRVTVNLKPILHPAELPPITMMNWLVVLEERRREFVSAD